MNKPHLLTMSGPNIVRIEIHLTDGTKAWVEDAPEVILNNAYCIVDSARIAMEKAKRTVPPEVHHALALLRGFHT